MSIDAFLGKVYHSGKYNCAHFVVDVWEHVTGVNIEKVMEGFLLPPKDRFVNKSIRKFFVKLDKPAHMSIVLMRRPRVEPHVGLFYKDRVLQIEKNGVSYQPLSIATIGFKKVSFYKCLLT